MFTRGAADAVADGTTLAVATPHIRPGHVTDVTVLPDRVAELRAALRREGIPLEVRQGGELAHTMVGQLDQPELDLIAQGPAGCRWVLLEAPFGGFGEEFHFAPSELRARGFGVLIAHPERAAGVGADPLRREVGLSCCCCARRPRLPEHGLPTALTMRADYDSTANVISIAITDIGQADQSDELHARAIVALADGKPMEVQLLYPDMGTDEPLAAVADRYQLDLEALHAAAQSALANPDRVVVLEIAERRQLNHP